MNHSMAAAKPKFLRSANLVCRYATRVRQSQSPNFLLQKAVYRGAVDDYVTPHLPTTAQVLET